MKMCLIYTYRCKISCQVSTTSRRNRQLLQPHTLHEAVYFKHTSGPDGTMVIFVKKKNLSSFPCVCIGLLSKWHKAIEICSFVIWEVICPRTFESQDEVISGLGFFRWSQKVVSDLFNFSWILAFVSFWRNHLGPFI